jgi:hypothetical protein
MEQEHWFFYEIQNDKVALKPHTELGVFLEDPRYLSEEHWCDEYIYVKAPNEEVALRKADSIRLILQNP